jgi:hypothetical protein
MSAGELGEEVCAGFRVGWERRVSEAGPLRGIRSNAYVQHACLSNVTLTRSIHDRGGDVLWCDLWRDGHLGHDVLDLERSQPSL